MHKANVLFQVFFYKKIATCNTFEKCNTKLVSLQFKTQVLINTSLNKLKIIQLLHIK